MFRSAGSVKMDRVAQCSSDVLRIAGKLGGGGGGVKYGGRGFFFFFISLHLTLINRTSTACLSSDDP